MADHIRVNTEQMEELAAQIKKLSSALDELESEVRGVRIDRNSGSELRVQLPSGSLKSIDRRFGSGSAKDCLRDIASVLSAMNRYTGRVAKNVDAASDCFYTTEQNLIWMFDGLSTTDTIFDGLCKALGYSKDRSKWTSTMHDKFKELLENAQVVVDGGLTFLLTEGTGYIFGENGILASFEQKDNLFVNSFTAKLFDGDSITKYESKDGLQDAGFKYSWKPVKKEQIGDGVKSYDLDGNEVEGEGVLGGKAFGLLSVGSTAGVSKSLWAKEGTYENGNFTAQGSVGVGNAEAHAGVTGGLGVYKPNEKGEMELYAGVGVDVGVSVSAAQAQGSLEYELIDNLAIGAEGEAALLKGEAGVNGGFGIIGGEPVLYGEASAEFNVAEAGGDVYLDVAGIKGSVGGSVSFGIGAHAKAGYKDGVVSVDVGAAVGLGVSVNFELDVGGAVENIGDGLEAVGDAVGDGIEAVGDALSEGWNAISSLWG